jgi:putative iron-dependent peroxidase
MALAQPGIFALGTGSHEYVELDANAGVSPLALVSAVANLREPDSTMGGVNLVSGYRPELWRALVPEDIPADLHSFEEPIVGLDGFTMPATQHDLWLWVAGASQDVVFDMVADAIGDLAQVATVATEVHSWPYHHDRDLTGFIDGTANPPVRTAPEAVLVPDGSPGAGGTVLLFQQWAHDISAWSALSTEEQERAMGRRKSDSEELADKPESSHVARTDQEMDGPERPIFRRNTPYGVVTDHGTMFVGFARDQAWLHRMLLRMAGVEDGTADALTRYTKPLSGAYYWVPSAVALSRFTTEPNATS